MKASQSLVQRYGDYYQALGRNWSMWWDATHLQYATMTVFNLDRGPEAAADSVFANAEQLKKRSGWFGELNSTIRFIFAALLDQKQDSPDAFMDELERVRQLFRQHKIRRGGLYEIVAIAILRLFGDSKSKAINTISESDIERFKEIHLELAKHQWWLTSIDDYPACAILAAQPGSPAEIAAQSEAIYQALYANGYWRGNPLQDAANLLYLAQEHPASISSRFHEIAETFRAKKVRIWQSEYDEVAVLSFTDGPADRIVDHVIDTQNELRQFKPRMSKQTAFNLACSMTLVETIRTREMEGVVNAKAVIDLNAVIAAQQAATVAACIAATTAASTAASSGG